MGLTRLQRQPLLTAALVISVSIALTSCGSQILQSGRHVSAKGTSSDTVAPQTTLTAPSTPVTTYVISDPPTTVINYPNPYQPSYDTVASLVDDSTFIVIASIGSETSINTYPLNVQQAIGATPPRVTIGISSGEFTAAHLAVGSTYIFFYGVDPTENKSCIVGGIRGVFAYDPTSGTVTRIDQSSSSTIPATQTLSQLETSINAAEQANAAQPQANTPPVCDSSATGLSNGGS